MNYSTKIIPIELSDGTVVKVEATPIGEQRIAYQRRPFQDAASIIKSIAREIAGTIQDIQQEVKPDKFSVTLGLKIAIESGQLTTLIVKGAGEANLEITMEWGA